MVDAHRPPGEWFRKWWTSSEFLPIVHEHNSRIPAEEFFNRPDLQPLREAYAAALFAWILGERQTVKVKLDDDRFPDFKLEVDGQTLPYELVEAYRPGERRGAEYKAAARRRAAGGPEVIEEFDPVADEQNAVPVIAKAIEKKASKHYGSAAHLLVYVNFWLFDKPKMTLGEFADLAIPWADKFPEIWLLWGANAIKCSPTPNMVTATALPKGFVA